MTTVFMSPPQQGAPVVVCRIIGPNRKSDRSGRARRPRGKLEVESGARLDEPVAAGTRAVTPVAAAGDLIAGFRQKPLTVFQPVIHARAGVGPRHVEAGDERRTCIAAG